MGSCAGRRARGDRPRVELAEVVRAHADDLGDLSREQSHALEAIANCRTAALGGHLHVCDSCDYKAQSYNSCRNRHCPKCGGLGELAWVDAREADVLPIEYFHLVFTISNKLHELFLCNKKLAYNLLFAAVSETLQEVALTNLGARLGFTAILHSWTQTLLYHPHVHCIIAGGGLDPSGTRWISFPNHFFVAVRKLSLVFRGKLLEKLRGALDRGDLFAADYKTADKALRQSARKKWYVYCKPSLLGPGNILRYLGRYTHRIGISNERLRGFHDGLVDFYIKDRNNDNRQIPVTLPAVKFLRRFLLHILPTGFMRVRHYGFLSNSSRSKTLPLCRAALGIPQPPARSKETWRELLLRTTGQDPTRCPHCEDGHLKVTQTLEPIAPKWALPGRASSP